MLLLVTSLQKRLNLSYLFYFRGFYYFSSLGIFSGQKIDLSPRDRRVFWEAKLKLQSEVKSLKYLLTNKKNLFKIALINEKFQIIGKILNKKLIFKTLQLYKFFKFF